jgi:hypothetical protein
MVAPSGVHMTIEREINQWGVWHLAAMNWCLGVSLGEKMDNAINLGGVTDMAKVQFQIKKLTDAANVQGQGRAIWEMVDQGLNLSIINGSDKKLH